MSENISNILKAEIVTIDETILIGCSQRLSLQMNVISSLWKKFVPLSFKIPKLNDKTFYAVQVFDESFEKAPFSPSLVYTHWACVEPAFKTSDNLPSELSTLEIPKGLYAKFLYKGSQDEFFAATQKLYSEWLPMNGYKCDQRPHFQIMREKYNPFSPDSEEEIYIPITK